MTRLGKNEKVQLNIYCGNVKIGIPMRKVNRFFFVKQLTDC